MRKTGAREAHPRCCTEWRSAGARRGTPFGKSSLVERTLAVRKTPLLRWDFHEVLSIEDVVYRSSVRLEAFLAEQSWVARKVASWFREVGVRLEAIRVGYRGAETSFSARIPTDHLARLLSHLEPLAKRRPFALFIDELQDLEDRLPRRQGDALLGLLRSELQRLSIPVFYAGSGRESFRALFMESRSPFYESAPLLEVPTIPSDDLREFIIEQFRPASNELSSRLHGPNTRARARRSSCGSRE